LDILKSLARGARVIGHPSIANNQRNLDKQALELNIMILWTRKKNEDIYYITSVQLPLISR